MNHYLKFATSLLLAAIIFFPSCKPKNAGSMVSGDAAQKTYVPPGKYDEFYDFVSGGFPALGCCCLTASLE